MHPAPDPGQSTRHAAAQTPSHRHRLSSEQRSHQTSSPAAASRQPLAIAVAHRSPPVSADTASFPNLAPPRLRLVRASRPISMAVSHTVENFQHENTPVRAPVIQRAGATSPPISFVHRVSTLVTRAVHSAISFATALPPASGSHRACASATAASTAHHRLQSPSAPSAAVCCIGRRRRGRRKHPASACACAILTNQRG